MNLMHCDHMKIPSNVSGVLLDIDWNRMVEVDLPIIKETRTIEYKDNVIEHGVDTYGEVMLMGDLHIGHASHTGNPFNTHLKFLEDRPHIKIGLMGDYIEYASKSFFVKDEVMGVDEQIDVFVKKFKPLADRIFFMLWGNHEERHAKYTDSKRLLRGISAEIGVSEHCYVADPQRGVHAVLKAGDKIYGLYAHHSKTGAIVNKTIQLRRAGFQNMSSIIAQGHTHHLGYEQRTFREMDVDEGNVRMITRRQWLVSTGCFIKDAGYAEARSYPLSTVGAPIIRLYSTKNKVEVTDIAQDYQAYLSRGGVVFGAKDGVQNWQNIYDHDNSFGVHKKCLI